MEQLLELLDILLKCDDSITEEQRNSMRDLYIAEYKLTKGQDPEEIKLKLAVIAGGFAELILKIKYNIDGIPQQNSTGL